MKISKLTTLFFVLGAIIYSPKVDAQNVPNILESGRESRLLLVQVNSQDAKAYHNRGFARSKLASVYIHFDFNEAEAYVYQSVARILSGDLKGAIEDCNQAIRLNPNYALAYNNRGFARLLSGDLKEAIEDFTQALRIDPSLAITHNNRGLARFKIGDLKGAIEDFTQALRIDPSLALAQNSQDSNPGQLEDVKGTIAKLQKVAKLFKEEGKIAEYQYTLDLIKKINIEPSGLYENGQPFLEVKAREQGDNYIKLKFCAEMGEKFQIRVTLNNATITEKFVI
jgi:tetratricopeptide (TPR) repeat protein